MFAVDHQVVMVPLVNKSPGFDVNKDMVPIARIVNFFTCLVVPGSRRAGLPGYLEAVRKSPTQGNSAFPHRVRSAVLTTSWASTSGGR